MTTSKVSFLILEKSYVIRSGLMKILGDFPETGKVYELEDSRFLFKIINREQVDVLIVNAKLIEDLTDVLHKIRNKFDNLNLIIFVGTRRSEDNFPGFDLKISVDESKTDIIEKFQKLIQKIKPFEKENLSEELSEREKDVVKQIALGKTNKEIGEALFISTHTVITHRKNITRKLGIKTVSGLTVYAILNNLIKIDDAAQPA